jgi:hypothetical protein
VITHVAIVFLGKTWYLPKPNRHCHVIWDIVDKLGVPGVMGEEQGFMVTPCGGECLDCARIVQHLQPCDGLYFLRRAPALHHAIKHDQLLKPTSHPHLYSEDLW